MRRHRGARFDAPYAASDQPALAQVIAEEWVGHPIGAAGAPGRASCVQNDAAWRAIFPDAHYVVEDIVAAGELAAARARVPGAQRGAFGDFAPTGRATAFEVVALWRVRHGQLAVPWSVEDYEDYTECFGHSQIWLPMREVGDLPEPLNNDVRRALTAYRDVRPTVADDHFFVGQRGAPLQQPTACDLEEAVRQLEVDAGAQERPR